VTGDGVGHRDGQVVHGSSSLKFATHWCSQAHALWVAGAHSSRLQQAYFYTTAVPEFFPRAAPVPIPVAPGLSARR
jgi:hypothetical protein